MTRDEKIAYILDIYRKVGITVDFDALAAEVRTLTDAEVDATYEEWKKEIDDLGGLEAFVRTMSELRQ